jgi:hypothetical protein
MWYKIKRLPRKTKILLSAGITAAVLAAAALIVFLAIDWEMAFDKHDRSRVDTFVVFPADTIYFYESSHGEGSNQYHFFDYIQGQLAQRTIRTTGISVTEVLVLTENQYMARMIDQLANPGNYLDEELRDISVIIQGPLRVGATWRSEAGGRFNEVVSLGARVTVPHGTFRCLHIRSTDAQVVVNSYYAPGIGMVKQIRQNVTPDGTVSQVVELVLSQIIRDTGFDLYQPVYFPLDGELASVEVPITHRTNQDMFNTHYDAINAVWLEMVGFEVDLDWIRDIDVLSDMAIQRTFPFIDFDGRLVEAMDGLPDEETERLMLMGIASTFSTLLMSNPCRDPFKRHFGYYEDEVYIFINGGAYTSERIQLDFADRITTSNFVEEEEWDWGMDDGDRMLDGWQ